MAVFLINISFDWNTAVMLHLKKIQVWLTSAKKYLSLCTKI